MKKKFYKKIIKNISKKKILIFAIILLICIISIIMSVGISTKNKNITELHDNVFYCRG